jgi:putative redox protein
MNATTQKVMATDPPRRIASLKTVVRVPLPADHPQRQQLENAAHTCPVHKSLSTGIDASIDFVWTG